MKTKKELGGKVWYRILKVFFILSFIISIIISFIFSYKISYNTDIQRNSGASLRQMINYAKQNPTSNFATQLGNAIQSGSLDSQAQKEGIDLSWAGRPKLETEPHKPLIDTAMFLINLIFITFLFILIRNTFYYIVLGNFNPKE